MGYRIGQLITLISAIAILVFAFSIQSDFPFYPLCGLGFVGLFLGIGLMVRHKPTNLPAERFKTINKFRGSNKTESGE